jgi:hypothetical protein
MLFRTVLSSYCNPFIFKHRVLLLNFVGRMHHQKRERERKPFLCKVHNHQCTGKLCKHELNEIFYQFFMQWKYHFLWCGCGMHSYLAREDKLVYGGWCCARYQKPWIIPPVLVLCSAHSLRVCMCIECLLANLWDWHFRKSDFRNLWTLFDIYKWINRVGWISIATIDHSWII